MSYHIFIFSELSRLQVCYLFKTLNDAYFEHLTDRPHLTLRSAVRRSCYYDPILQMRK